MGIELFKKAYKNKEGKTRYQFYICVGGVFIPVGMQYYKTEGKGNEDNDKYNFANYKLLLAVAKDYPQD